MSENIGLPQLLLMAEQYFKDREVPESTRRAMCVSFAYGNCAIENPNVTKELVEREYDKIKGTT